MEQTAGVWIPLDKLRLASFNMDIRTMLTTKDSSKD